MSTAWLVIFAWMLIGQGSARLLDENCGNVVKVVAKIVGGKDAGEDKNPWMAIIKSHNVFVCGGTLINDRFVMTAAHCICNNTDCSVQRTQLTATLGMYHSQSENQSESKHAHVSNVVRAHLHTSFVMESHVHDICLLQLARSVVYKENIKPICILLNEQNKPQADAIQNYTAVGWGETGSMNASGSDALQVIQIYKLNREECINYFWDIHDTQICGGRTDEKDTCNGDSGGPLYAEWLYGSIWRATQFGIVSAGNSECRGFGMYTDVMSHIDFIERIALDSDIEVVLPKLDLLDDGCLGQHTLRSWEGNVSEATRSFEWLAEVYMQSFLVSYGVLISKTFVVTTAQMLPEDVAFTVQLGQGVVDTFDVTSVHKHPEFVSLAQNDIALLKLDRAVQYTESIRPICLPSPSNKAQQKKFQGWAADPAQKLITVGRGIRTNVAVRRTNSSECYQEDHQEIGERQLCVERPAPQILRVGSGSPLVSPLFEKKGAFSLVGLASFGRSEDFSPDVYTNVLGHLKWIGDLLKK
ncbi:serine protease 48 [Drosophila teissieri]|uniref:serine protease 48 n=1 Tax=Drosophila teissieri TaxID=7243 RepID=UPI001CB9E714|nr:serine protease 48 [Drosophila teissieri]